MYFSISAFPPVILSERSILSGLILLVLLPASSSIFRIYPPSLRFLFLFSPSPFRPAAGSPSLCSVCLGTSESALPQIYFRAPPPTPAKSVFPHRQPPPHEATSRVSELLPGFPASFFLSACFSSRSFPLMSLYWSRELVSSTMLMP